MNKAGNRGNAAYKSIQVILLIGAPGSGKGTQSALLAANYGAVNISTGAMLRAQSKQNSPAGFELRRMLASGQLVDDRVVCDLVASRIRELICGNGGTSVILDGFPRTVRQAQMLDQMLKAMRIPEPLVLNLDVPESVLLKRLAGRRQCAKCGAIYNLSSAKSSAGSRCKFDGGALVERDDDSEGTVRRRLAAYREETYPLLDYYYGSERGTACRTLDGNRPAAEIAKDVATVAGFLSPAAVAA